MMSKAAVTTTPVSALPTIYNRGIYADRIRDRSPGYRPAGLLTATGDSASLCMSTQERPPSPEVVRRFRASLQPDAGRKRVFYGKAYDPQLQWSKNMNHGLMTHSSGTAKDMLNPNPKTRFQQSIINRRENLYASHQRPLGRSHDQRPWLPSGLNPEKFSFGLKTEIDGSSGELVNPNRSRKEVDDEYELGRDLYRKTHFGFRVGEQCDRDYMTPSYTNTATFGVPTPHANDGRHVRKTMHWLHDAVSERMTPIVSKRLDDFRERTQPQLGKVHDPIKDTLNVAPNHTFGVLLKPDEYGAGDLMHGRAPGAYLRGKDRIRGVIAAMRQHLKKANYHNFHDLLAAFRFYDKEGKGTIDINNLREACSSFNLPVETELLEALMHYCAQEKDGQINYMEFANFLNWKDKMPSGLPPQSAPAGNIRHDETTNGETERPSTTIPARLQKQVDSSVGGHRTSSSMVSAVVGGVSTRGP